MDGAFVGDLLPGIVLVAIGAGAVFTGVTTAATEGVPADQAGIASGLLNASMQFGGALGLAVLSAVATGRTNTVLDSAAALPARPHRRLPARLPDRRRASSSSQRSIAFIAASTHADEHRARPQELPTANRGRRIERHTTDTAPSQGRDRITHQTERQPRRKHAMSNDTICSEQQSKTSSHGQDTHERTRGRAEPCSRPGHALCTRES